MLMVRLFVILLLSCCASGRLLAQNLPGVIPSRASLSPSTVLEAPKPTSHLLGGFHMSAVGMVGTAAFSLTDRGDRMAEIVVGFGRASSSFVPAVFINGTQYTRALHLVPVYVGMRIVLARGGGSPVSWSWYLRGGAGPTFGLVTPMGLEFFDALHASTFHWGLGVYGATGLEVVVDNSIALFVQLGAEGVGFVRSIEDRSSLIGPSITFGVGRLMP